MARTVNVEYPLTSEVDLSRLVDRVLVFDDFYTSTQILLMEQWALKTPHWMLTNSVYDALGSPKHRIWGASYIGAWKRHGWTGLPPVLFAGLGLLFQRLGVIVTQPEYIGLNGQSRGQDASIHVDCERDAPDQLSILIYLGEDTDGDLLLFDKEDRERQLGAIEFRRNRVVLFDGSIPHAACAPNDSRFRMSVIVRGTYACRRVGLRPG